MSAWRVMFISGEWRDPKMRAMRAHWWLTAPLRVQLLNEGRMPGPDRLVVALVAAVTYLQQGLFIITCAWSGLPPRRLKSRERSPAVVMLMQQLWMLSTNCATMWKQVVTKNSTHWRSFMNRWPILPVWDHTLTRWVTWRQSLRNGMARTFLWWDKLVDLACSVSKDLLSTSLAISRMLTDQIHRWMWLKNLWNTLLDSLPYNIAEYHNLDDISVDGQVPPSC